MLVVATRVASPILVRQNCAFPYNDPWRAGTSLDHILATPMGVESQMTAETSLVDQLRGLDAAIDEAASNGDFGVVESLLADDFIYTHSTGKVETKAEWIDGLKPLTGKRRRVASGITVELHGDVAVVWGDVDINWADGRAVLNRYVRVYRLQDGRWQAISQRTVKAPDRTS